MWTPATRRQHSRKNLRYETDLTDEEWAIIAPYLPGSPVRGRPHKWSMREIVNAIFYVLRGGVAWSLLESSFTPPPSCSSSGASAAQHDFSDGL